MLDAEQCQVRQCLKLLHRHKLFNKEIHRLAEVRGVLDAKECRGLIELYLQARRFKSTRRLVDVWWCRLGFFPIHFAS